MKTKKIINPELNGDYIDSIIQAVPEFALTKDTFINIPVQFDVISIAGNGLPMRIEPGVDINLYKKFKPLNVKEGTVVQIYYVYNKTSINNKWGFGNIPINNKRLKGAYHIGAYGTFNFIVKSPKNLIYSFNMSKNITATMICDKIINVIRTVGVDVLSKYFTNTEISFYEINSLNNEIRMKMLEAINKEKAVEDIGISLTSLSLEPITIRDEDERMIANRLNETEE